MITMKNDNILTIKYEINTIANLVVALSPVDERNINKNYNYSDDEDDIKIKKNSDDENDDDSNSNNSKPKKKINIKTNNDKKNSKESYKILHNKK
jgi:hypothetical protein